LSFGLRALAEQTKTLAVPAPGHELFTALRQSQVRIDAKAAVSFRYWATAVAAMVLLMIAIVAVRSRSTAPEKGQAVLNPPPPVSIAPTPEVVVDSLTPGKSEGVATNRGTRGQRRNLKRPSIDTVATQPDKDIAAETAASDTTSEPEITTEFMPIGYATDSSIRDGGQLVRVELPRSALLAFGLPMNVNRYDERVKADVFFGADGMARAIRFVQ
jgi:hypothetical protein